MEPTLVQVFGAGAVQDSSTLTIQKSALAAKGLTSSANNTAESLVVALFKQWETYLTAANLDANAEQQISIENSYQSIITRNNTQYRQFAKTINLQVVDMTSDIDPNKF